MNLLGIKGQVLFIFQFLLLKDFQSAREANKEFDPKVQETKQVIDNVQKSLANVNNSMKKIKKEMGDFK